MLLGGVALAAIFAVALGAVVSLVLRRRLERLTLGLQPEELAGLVQNQAAVLDGVGDGVLAYGPDGVVTVANTTATRLLGTPDLVGRGIRDLDLPAPVLAALSRAPPTDRNRADAAEPLSVGAHVVFIDTRPVSRADRDLGLIAVIRDRADVVTLTDRLETVASMTDALRVQRHEFANRLHVDSRPDRCGPRARRTRLSRRSARGIARGRDRAADRSTRRTLPGVIPGVQGTAGERARCALESERGLARARRRRTGRGRRHSAGESHRQRCDRSGHRR